MDVSQQVNEHLRRATEDVDAEQYKLAEQRLDYENETLAVLQQELGLKIYASTIFKLSKYLKHWRERRLILTPHALGTFEVKGQHMSATEWILLRTIKDCWVPTELDKHDPIDKFVFVLKGIDKNGVELQFRFCCSTIEERDKWILLINQECKKCKK